MLNVHCRKLTGPTLFIIGLTFAGCGLAFSKTDFIDATADGKLKRGQTLEEVREIVGKPDSTRSAIVGGTPYEVWIYMQTSVADKRKNTAAAVVSLGLLGFLPVGASDKHYIVFENGKVVSWDSIPTALASQEHGGGSVKLSAEVFPVFMPQKVKEVSRIAIVPVSENFGTDIPAQLDYTVGFIRALRPEIVFVERGALEKIADEIKLQYSGRVDDGTSKRVGQMVGADTLLLYKIFPFDTAHAGLVLSTGGAISGGIEINLVQVETGTSLFRQSVSARTVFPTPRKGGSWTEEGVRRAHGIASEEAAAYGFSALAASLGANPLGIVPFADEAGKIMDVLSASSAEAAGLKKGDKIISVNNRPYRSWTDPINLPATLTILREGKELQLSVTSR